MEEPLRLIRKQLNKSILLAVSGGLDSMVLLHLLKIAGAQFGIAHCNFGLRGKESDEDQAFVEQAALKLNVPFFTKRFDTQSFAKQNGISLQMAARQLRYQWFWQIVDNQNYDLLATAHHADDNLETVLLNLIRGTGFEGIGGMSELDGRIFRPLICVSRHQIRLFALNQGIVWREDSSNSSNYYRRNFLRNKVIPLLKELNPNLIENSVATLNKIRLASQVLESSLRDEEAAFSSQLDNELIIDFQTLNRFEYANFRLYQRLKPFGFSLSQCDKMLNAQSGKQFFAQNHRAVIGRNKLIVLPIENQSDNQEIKLTSDEIVGFRFGEFEFDINEEKPEEFAPDNWFLDFYELNFPLVIRKWRKGDRFRPLGMKGYKKISDFLIDKKISLHQKEKIWILKTGEEIACVLGLAVGERFKLTEQTQKILIVRKIQAK